MARWVLTFVALLVLALAPAATAAETGFLDRTVRVEGKDYAYQVYVPRKPLEGSKPVILATLIAWPVAWWLMRDWLNGFDARIDLGPTPFLVAGLLALAIAVGTISGHAVKVARANPIHALRYE